VIVTQPTMQPQVPGTQPQPQGEGILHRQMQTVVHLCIAVIIVAGCPQGQHYFTTHYPPCGIIAAILLFPIGLIFLLCVVQFCLPCSGSCLTLCSVRLKKGDVLGAVYKDNPVFVLNF
jgi:uncharacterized membrane protein